MSEPSEQCPICGASLEVKGEKGSSLYRCGSGSWYDGYQSIFTECALEGIAVRDAELADAEREVSLQATLNRRWKHETIIALTYCESVGADKAAGVLRSLLSRMGIEEPDPRDDDREKFTLFKAGDAVTKAGGDYRFDGIIVSAFRKLAGPVRYVVEDDRGILHIYSDKNLKAASVPLPEPSEKQP